MAAVRHCGVYVREFRMLDNFFWQVMEGLASLAPWQLALLLVLSVAAAAVLRLFILETYVSWTCRHIPTPDGRLPLLGHALKLLK